MAIMLDGWRDEWGLFPWIVYCPALTIAAAWFLIRWKKKLVLLALAIGAMSAASIINQLYAELRYRAESKTRLEAILQHTLKIGPGSPTYVSADHQEALIRAIRAELNSFDSSTLEGIPAYTQHMIAAVWFVALFPFFMIAVFYRAALHALPPASASI